MSSVALLRNGLTTVSEGQYATGYSSKTAAKGTVKFANRPCGRMIVDFSFKTGEGSCNCWIRFCTRAKRPFVGSES